MFSNSNTRRRGPRRHLALVRSVAVTASVIGVGFVTFGGADSVSAGGPTCGGQPATIVGDANDNIIDGTPGNDVIVSGAGDDVVAASAATTRSASRVARTGRVAEKARTRSVAAVRTTCCWVGKATTSSPAMPASDVIGGGDDVDRASYNLSPAAVVVNLTAGSGTGEGSDTIVAVENATGSAFDDTLIGTGGPNSLDGLRGDDLLVGGRRRCPGRP